MKKRKKSACEFSSQRSEFLIRNFREAIARESFITAKKIFQDVTELPAPRFWVSEIRALKVIQAILRGEDVLEGMLPHKREMYKEIYRRVTELRLKNPDTPLGDLVFEVVNSEAPCSYMGWDRAGKLINEVRNKR